MKPAAPVMRGSNRCSPASPPSRPPNMHVQDHERIARGIAQAKAEEREIDHLTAKIIAAQFHDGSAQALAFLSAGAIQGTPSGLWRAFGGDYRSHTTAERGALDW